MKKTKSGSKEGKGGDSPSQLIDARIKELNDWRGEMLARIRKLIHEADPEVVEEVKWRKPSNPAGVPVWSHDGIICTGETYKDKVKLTFFKGASLADPAGLFNSRNFAMLLSSDLSTILNTYQGSTTNGNTITRHSRFQNISGIPFEITGVVDIQSLDPEDLGFPDLTPENAAAAKAAMAALYPNTDLFAFTAWLGGNQSRRTWETEITFGSPFPILVNPGEEFEFVQVSRNDRFGPNFGPSTAPLPAAQTEYIGEIVIAFDFDWHYVPEPGGYESTALR